MNQDTAKKPAQNNGKMAKPHQAIDPLQGEDQASSKFDQEPNPFEQSFSGASDSPDMNANNGKSSKFVLPPAASIASPSTGLTKGIFPKEITDQFGWDSLRTGPLSPSMLQKPADATQTMDGATLGTNNRIGSISNPPGGFSFQGMTSNTLYEPAANQQAVPATGQYQDMNGGMFQGNSMGPQSDMYMMQQRQNMLNMSMPMMDANSQAYQPQQQSYPSRPAGSTSPTNKRSRRKTTDDNTTEDSMSQTSESSHQNTNGNKSRKKSAATKDADDDEKRRNFLERNRQAALKCRQRKKQWLNNLQAKVEYLTNDNEQLQLQANALREEIINLKTLLLAHKDCAVAQQNGVVGLNLLQRPPGGPGAMDMSTMSGATAGSNMPPSSAATNTIRF
ncbi:Transcription factor, variant 2 [Umbelopsis sp. WA50703]